MVPVPSKGGLVFSHAQKALKATGQGQATGQGENETGRGGSATPHWGLISFARHWVRLGWSRMSTSALNVCSISRPESPRKRPQLCFWQFCEVELSHTRLSLCQLMERTLACHCMPTTVFGRYMLSSLPVFPGSRSKRAASSCHALSSFVLFSPPFFFLLNVHRFVFNGERQPEFPLMFLLKQISRVLMCSCAPFIVSPATRF